jgi:hypothetical protein
MGEGSFEMVTSLRGTKQSEFEHYALFKFQLYLRRTKPLVFVYITLLDETQIASFLAMTWHRFIVRNDFAIIVFLFGIRIASFLAMTWHRFIVRNDFAIIVFYSGFRLLRSSQWRGTVSLLETILQ